MYPECTLVTKSNYFSDFSMPKKKSCCVFFFKQAKRVWTYYQRPPNFNGVPGEFAIGHNWKFKVANKRQQNPGQVTSFVLLSVINTKCVVSLTITIVWTTKYCSKSIIKGYSISIQKRSRAVLNLYAGDLCKTDPLLNWVRKVRSFIWLQKKSSVWKKK